MQTILIKSIIVILYCTSLLHTQTVGEVDTVVSTGSFIMGENDSRSDAKEYALMDAKRKAIEQFGTFIKSTTQVENYQVTQDEITTYAAGVMKTTILDEKLDKKGDQLEMKVSIQAVIDPAEVEESIKLYRESQVGDDELQILKDDLGAISQKTVTGEKAQTDDRTINRDKIARLKEFGRIELLSGIIIESRKKRPSIPKMKLMVAKWLKKYPEAKFVSGYLGIALYKNGRKKLALPALRNGLMNLGEIKKRLSSDSDAKKIKLINSQERQFKYFLNKCIGKNRK